MCHQFIYWLIGNAIMVIHQLFYICKMVCHNFDLILVTASYPTHQGNV